MLPIPPWITDPEKRAMLEKHSRLRDQLFYKGRYPLNFYKFLLIPGQVIEDVSLQFASKEDIAAEMENLRKHFGMQS